MTTLIYFTAERTPFLKRCIKQGRTFAIFGILFFLTKISKMADPFRWIKYCSDGDLEVCSTKHLYKNQNLQRTQKSRHTIFVNDLKFFLIFAHCRYKGICGNWQTASVCYYNLFYKINQNL